MIKKEFYMTRSDGVNLYKTYSDKGVKIKQIQTDVIYDEAIDIENSTYIYEDTDILIENEENFEI